MHNFTQSGWLILFKPDHLPGSTNWGNCQTLFGWTTSFSADISLSALRPRVPSWIWIRWHQYATHRDNFTSPPKLAMSTAMPNSAPTPSDYTSGQHFLETFTLLPETTRTTNSRWLQRFSPQIANSTLATLRHLCCGNKWHTAQIKL